MAVWLVIIEIKTRTEPVQADWHRMVSRAQQDRLIRAARAFLARHPERSLEVRFDVVAVLRNRYGHRILHTESAFYPLLPGRLKRTAGCGDCPCAGCEPA